ncbi:MAG TPA: TonB-dependent receptor [Gemmatimonadaceae bacterium]|nr:TonB-dependent receptor [Gemmatimonadaceae bacterium]
MYRLIARGVRACIPRTTRSAPGALLVVFLALPALASAQTATSNLRGYVRGDNATAAADVTVTLRSLETNQRRVTTTATSGYYYLGGLRPGQYEVSARKLGMAPQTRTVRLLIGQTLDVDFSLTTAAVQLAAVAVSANTEARETRTSEVSTNVTREQIDNLPSAERNFLDIARLAPGLTATEVNDSRKFLSAGGQPAEAVNVFVDGVSYKNDVLRGGVVGQDASKGNPFPQAAVQEFRVLTQNYKAEYQKAASAIISATTRTGTNRWEGDFFGYRVDKGLVARDAFTASTTPPGPPPNYSRLQAGGSIGGPIQRDKLFFFGTYELNARDEPQTVTLGPNAAQAPAGLNPQQYAGRFISEFREHLGFGKLTWVRSERSSLDGTFSLRKETDFRGFGGATSYQSAENVRNDTYSGGVSWKYAGDRWLNEVQVNAQHFTWKPTPVNPDLVAKVYEQIVTVGGRDGRQDWVQDRVSFRDDITRAGVQWFGDHAFKTGASMDLLGYSATKDFQFTTPVYRFRSNENYARPYNASFAFGDPKVSTSNAQFGLYVQDDWNVTRKLVLNLGIRWDAETNAINNSYVTPQPLADSLRALAGNLVVNQPTPTGTQVVPIMQNLGGIERFITAGRSDRPMYLKAFQPRLGASYDVFGDERTVFFGGFGIYYDRNYWNTLFDEKFRRQFRQMTINFNNACAPTDFACAVWNDTYFDPAQLRTLSFATAPEVFLVANDLEPPKTHQYSAGVRQAYRGLRLTASYNGIRGFNGMNYVRVSPFGGPETTNPRNYNTVFASDDRVKTWYDALQLQVERPLRGDTRWGGAVAYTLARTEEQGQSTDIFWGFDDRYPTVADRPRLRAPGDQRHAIVANGIVRLPYQFMLSGIVNLGSGIAINSTDATAGNGPFERKFYIFEPPGRPFLGMGHVFAYQNADFRVEKALRLAQGQETAVVFDLFNAFNSANWGCYGDRAGIPPQVDQTPAWRAQYGTPNCAGLGRRLQLGLRYGYRAQ